jgi:aspartate carbamoyltransferase regulatory subunit
MKDPHEIIDHITPTDTLSILRTLTNSDNALAEHITEMVMSSLSGMDLEEIAAQLCDELDALEVENL